MADEYRLDEVFKAKKTAWRAFQGAKDGRPSGTGQSFIAPSRSLYRLARLGQDILSWCGRFLFATAGQFCRSAIRSTS